MRAALAWALETDERELGLELVRRARELLGDERPQEGAEWAAALLDGAPASPRPRRARPARAGRHGERARQHDRAAELWERALAIARALERRAGGRGPPPPALEHRAGRGDWQRRRALAEESLAGHRRVGFREGRGAGADLPRRRRAAPKAISSARSSSCRRAARLGEGSAFAGGSPERSRTSPPCRSSSAGSTTRARARGQRSRSRGR